MTLSMPLVFALGIVWLGDRWLGDGPTIWDRTSVVVPRVAQVGLTVIAGLAAVDLVRTSIEILDGNPYG